jgi:hypothetical protein
MPRISVVALIGSGVRIGAGAAGCTLALSGCARTKNPRWRRASTRPCACNWS